MLTVPLALWPQTAPDSWTKPIEGLIASGKLVDARELLRREAGARGETSDGLYLEAKILFEEGRYENALTAVQRSLLLDARNAESYKLAALSAIRLDRLDIAEEALKSAARLSPDDYLAHFHLGALYYSKSLFLAAKLELQRAVALNPSYMPALLFLGLTLEEVGDERDAIESYRRAIGMAGAQAVPYVYLGRYLYRLNRFEEALPLLEKAIAINAASGEALLERGKTLHALKRDQEAAAALERSALVDARNPEPHYLLFRIYVSEGREQDAQQELRRFRELKPAGAGDEGRRRIQPVSFNKHIAPLIFQHCSQCHRPGEAAPFPLLNYADVRRHASQIVAVTERGYMPPWPPEQGYGDFAGERRLTAEEVKLFAEWVKGGEPEGDAADMPEVPHFTEGWQLGPPDLVVQMPASYRLAAGGGDVFRNFVVPIGIKEAKFVRALEIRPGNKRVVHHANLLIGRKQTTRSRDGEDGQPGFSGMTVVPEARTDSFDPDSHFLFWKPGTVIEPEPEDMSWRLDPDSDLILNLHLQPSGKEEVIQPVIGFYFTSTPPARHPMLVQLENDGAIDIPAGARGFAVADRLTLPVDVEVLAVYPHAHYLGQRVEAWATLPKGTRIPLIRIMDWDINWQAVYKYRKPVSLPKGATVEMRISYDNSAENPRNPNHPPKRVLTGPRSQDEMGHVWLQVLPGKESDTDPRVTLQEALMRRRLEKYPGDFVAYCNLGALKTMREQYREAAADFEQALREQPASATARNGLGAALLGEGHAEDAIRELREALRIDSIHLNARWNLSKALVRKGDLAGAATELETLLKQKPDHDDAQVGLAMLYFMQRRYDDAMPHFREAIRLRPGDSDVRTNLGAMLATRGDFPGAIQAFEEALKLNPSDAKARDYLARARSELAGEKH